MRRLKHKVLKLIYKLLIFKIIVADKENFTSYDKLKTFCEFTLPTNIGNVIFIFKEDRRSAKRKIDKIFFISNFFVELKVPPEIEVKEKIINDKIIIVLKFMLFKVDYKILAELLLDIYVTSMLKIFDNTKRPNE